MFRTKKEQTKTSFLKTTFNKILYSTMFLPLFASSAQAGSSRQLTSVIDKTADFLSGGVAKSIAIIAIIGVGYLTIFTQQLPKKALYSTVGGLGLIFCATTLYAAIF